VDTAREQLAELTGASPGRIIFTSGGTEANALALANAGRGKVFVSAIEHPSVFNAAQALFKDLKILAVDKSGLLALDTIKEQSPQAGDFVSVMWANNETGVIQNLAEISVYLNEIGVVMHSDAVQALGKMPVSFKNSGIRLMSLSSHKINGPKGCGALLCAANMELRPLHYGGDQEQGLRAGTENVAGIVGFGKAAELANRELMQRISKMHGLKTRLEQQLAEIPGLHIFAEQAPRLVNTVQFGVNGTRGDMLLMQLDRRNIAVSSGSACSAISRRASPVLTAMGVTPELAGSAIRVSLGQNNNEQEVDEFVQILKTLLEI
jgi:cysteine desulfurase